jgi:hypothetical protein
MNTSLADRTPVRVLRDDTILVDRIGVRDLVGPVGIGIVEEIVRHEMFPAPVIGGRAGSKALWNRGQVIDALNRILVSA